MSAALRWERELELPGMVGEVRILVCRACGAVLRRRLAGGDARVVGEHVPGCHEREVDYGARELFA